MIIMSYSSNYFQLGYAHLKNEVCKVTMELSNFSWQLCVKTMIEETFAKWEKGIILILYKFKPIFPQHFLT